MGASLLMERTMEINEEVNPLEDPKQREIIDEILNKNKDLPGATMVVLNSLQEIFESGIEEARIIGKVTVNP
jgi:hypothetical protein